MIDARRAGNGPRPREEQYAMISVKVMSTLTAPEIAVYCAIDSWDKGFRPDKAITTTEIEDDLPLLTEEAIRKAINSLHDRGFIEKTQESSGGKFHCHVDYNPERGDDPKKRSYYVLRPRKELPPRKAAYRTPRQASPRDDDGNLVKRNQPMCKGWTSGGRPCRAKAKGDGDLCVAHLRQQDRGAAAFLGDDTPTVKSPHTGPTTHGEITNKPQTPPTVESPISSDPPYGESTVGVPDPETGREGKAVAVDRSDGLLDPVPDLVGASSASVQGDGLQENSPAPDPAKRANPLTGEIHEGLLAPKRAPRKRTSTTVRTARNPKVAELAELSVVRNLIHLNVPTYEPDLLREVRRIEGYKVQGALYTFPRDAAEAVCALANDWDITQGYLDIVALIPDE